MALKHSSAIDPGSRIAGRYRALRTLGSGALGQVYLVEDLDLDRQHFALKLLHDGLLASLETQRRLQAEIILSRQLSHPNIVRVYELEHCEQYGWYLSMEYVNGCSLSELLEGYQPAPMPLLEATCILEQVLQGLVFAHQRQVVHRDLKADNILLDQLGAVKIADFGFAASLDDELGFTKTGQAIGSPEYMAPEAFTAAQLDARADLYSFGILAYRMLTGHFPFIGETFYALAKQHREQPVDLNALDIHEVPQALRELISCCLAKNPLERPATAVAALSRMGESKASKVDLRSEIKEIQQRRSKASRLWQRPLGILQLSLASTLLIISVATLLFEERARTRVAEAAYLLEQYQGLDLSLVKRLVGYQQYDLDRYGLLHDALDDSEFILSTLLEAGANPYDRDAQGRTVFHAALSKDRQHLTRLLQFASRISPSAAYPKDREGNTPLHYALFNQAPYQLAAMLSYEVDLERQNERGDTILHTAVRMNNYTFFWRLLVEPGRPAYRDSLQNDEGLPVLHLAALNARIEELRLMLQRGFEVDVRDAKGNTALALLLQQEFSLERKIIAEELLSFGAQWQRYNDEGVSTVEFLCRGPSWRASFRIEAMEHCR